MESLKGSLEDNIVAALVWSQKAGYIIRMALDLTLLSNPYYRKIARSAFTYYDKYNAPPGDHISDLLEGEMKDDAENKLYTSLLFNLRDMHDVQNPDYILDELERFLEARRLKMSLLDAQEALEQGKIEEAKDLLISVSANKRFSSGTDLSDPDSALKFLNRDEDEFIRLGIEFLDNNGLTPARGNLFTVMAGTGKGKSWSAVHFGKTAMMDGHQVLHVSLEMTEEEVVERYVMSLFGCASPRGRNYDDAIYKPVAIPYFVPSPDGRLQVIETIEKEFLILKTESANVIREKIELLKHRPPLHIKSFPAGSLTLSQFKAWLNMMEVTKGLSPDVLILDYPKRLKFRYSDNESRRNEYGDLYGELKGLAQERRFVLHAPWQSNRIGMQSDIIRDYHSGDSIHVVQESDFVLTYNQTDAEAQIGMARLFFAKSRFGRSGLQSAILQNYEIGQFALECLGGYGERPFEHIVMPRTNENEEEERPARRRRARPPAED